MRVAVALVLSLTVMSGACFPNNPRHQTYAKIAEGGALLGGIGLLFVVNTGADCTPLVSGMPDTDCEDKASLLGNIGLGLVLAGLIGFIVTVSTSGDDKVSTSAPTAAPPPPPPVEPAPTPADPTPAPTPAPTEPVPPTAEPATPTAEPATPTAP